MLIPVGNFIDVNAKTQIKFDVQSWLVFLLISKGIKGKCFHFQGVLISEVPDFSLLLFFFFF